MTSNQRHDNLVDWRTIVMGFFGTTVIISGLWRFFSAEGGHAGLWFGLVMGGLAWISAGLFHFRRDRFANVIGWTSIAFVQGWFMYESFIKKALGDAEIRQLIVIAISTMTAAAMAIAFVAGPQADHIASAARMPESPDDSSDS